MVGIIIAGKRVGVVDAVQLIADIRGQHRGRVPSCGLKTLGQLFSIDGVDDPGCPVGGEAAEGGFLKTTEFFRDTVAGSSIAEQGSPHTAMKQQMSTSAISWLSIEIELNLGLSLAHNKDVGS